jgi:hypothetical protein
MKTLLFLIISFPVFSQNMTYDEVKALQRSVYYGIQSYTAKNGETFKVGDKITIGQPSNGLYFNHIDMGDGILIAFQAAGSSAAGQEIEIKKITASGTKKFGFKAYLQTRGAFGGYQVSIENALETGEVVSSIMSSDQALTELKKAKDKLDLGLITQMEFDSIKTVLAPIIK